MRIKSDSLKFYYIHFRIIIIIILAFLTRPFRLYFRKKNKPVVILFGHLLDGNLKPIFEKGLKSDFTLFDTFFLTLDPTVYSSNINEHKTNILLATKFFDICRVFDSDSIVTSHGPMSLKFINYLRPSLPFIDVWHGVAFMDYTPGHFKDMRFYKAFFSSSEYFKSVYEIYRGFDKKKVIATGMAKHDVLFNNNKIMNKIKKELNIEKFSKIILYAPTWWGGANGHLENDKPFNLDTYEFLTKVNNICKDSNYLMIFRLHQNSSLSVKNKVFSNILSLPQYIYQDTYSLLSCIDLLITDWSSIASDFSALNRPIIYIDNPPPIKFNNSGLPLPIERGGVIVKNMESFLNEILNVLRNKVYEIPKSQIKLKNEVFGNNYDGNCTIRCCNEINKLIHR